MRLLTQAPKVQIVLELFLEKAAATGLPDADSPPMVALGADTSSPKP